VISVVSSGTQSVFAIPSTDITPAIFSAGNVVLTIKKNGTLLTLTTHYTLTPAGFITMVTPCVVGDVIDAQRATESDSLLTTWPSANGLTQSHLKKDSYQWLYLIQELTDAITASIQYVISSAGAIVWDFLSHRGINCLDPVGAQDVATKNYVDTLVTAEAALRAGAVSAEAVLRVAGDASTLASAKAYADALVSGALVATTGYSVLHGSLAVTPGDTVVTFPITFDFGLIILQGIPQAPVTDYSHTTGTDEITFTSAVPAGCTLVTYILFNAP
jgi:hypothetical protein